MYVYFRENGLLPGSQNGVFTLGLRSAAMNQGPEVCGDHENPLLIEAITNDIQIEKPTKQHSRLNVQKTALAKHLGTEVKSKLERILADKSPG